jgi:tripartite-type tricarboxylate transporter receptor subunit TctC
MNTCVDTNVLGKMPSLAQVESASSPRHETIRVRPQGTRTMRKVLAVLLCALSAGIATAQSFPAKPIRFVSTAVAGATDTVGRLIAAGLTERVHQQVIIDSRGGANGIIGTEIVAHANPDGYTLLISTASFAINPSIYRKLPYSPLDDFAPVSLIMTSGGLFLITHPSVPAHNIRELIELDKAKPGQIAYGSAGVGNITHMAGELFNIMAGTHFNHVPYKGAAAAFTDVLGSHVSFMYSGAIQCAPSVKAGKVRALAFTGISRSKVLPEVATLDELGLKSFDVSSWYAIYAPAKTPKVIVNYLRDAVVAVVREPQASEMLEGWGLTPVGNTPEQFAEFLRKEIAKYSHIVREAKISRS